MSTIDEHEVDLPTPTGPMRTVVFAPTGGAHPGIVFASEIFQITAPIRRSAAFLAGHGFVVAVPEVYHDLEPRGSVLAYDTAGAARGNADKLARPIAAFDADVRAVLDHLAGSPACTGRLGAIGICLGGHIAFRAALHRDVLATACCYATDIHKGSLGSGGDDTMARMGDVRGEMLMIWGRQDPHIPDAGRRLIHDRMTEAGITFTWHEWNGAHAFLRDESSGGRYDPALSRLCWELMLEMFGRRLKQ
ncbi:MAG TPA: dienelactone hydrolase family protein [Planctomycetota bacterium]|nr:dienelactone hydrolase family protein [Planctomycetota bacterium]